MLLIPLLQRVTLPKGSLIIAEARLIVRLALRVYNRIGEKGKEFTAGLFFLNLRLTFKPPPFFSVES
jgi:hypothetical protein